MKEIPLTQGKVAVVDDEDYERLMAYKWHASEDNAGVWYARGYIPTTKKKQYMHRLITSAAKGQLVDHRNGDGLDNRRDNLRICTSAQNKQNQTSHRSETGLKGVRRLPRRLRKRYRAAICVNGSVTHLGYYITSEEAALAYDAAARKYSGEFARLNFPNSVKEDA